VNGNIILQHQGSNASFRTFHLRPGTFILGRSAKCDFVVADGSISRRHAEIALLDGQVTVRDLDSRNGTFLDGRKVERRRVHRGQSLRFGDVTFILAFQMNEDMKIGSEVETDRGDDSDPTLNSDQSPFTPAQIRVYNLLKEGLNGTQIAERLFLSRNTVHLHVAAIYRILEVHSRSEFFAKLLPKNGQKPR
jgi:DNA-binding CsgD family transcriptional regulator